MRELIQMTTEAGFPKPLGISTGQALQEALDRAVMMWRFADDQLDKVVLTSADEDPNAPFEGFWEELPGAGGSVVVEPNRWYRLSQEARKDVEKLAGMMTQLGIAERHVRVEEARATLVIAAIKEAAMEAGLSNDQIRLLGTALRGKLDQATADSPLAHDPKHSVGMTRSQTAATSKAVASRGPGH